MKKVLLYLLLFAYSSIVFRPLYPSIADTIAHIFWYSEHMATVHYEHGKYHVHIENINEAKKGSPEKNSSIKYDASLSIHLLNERHFYFIAFPQVPEYARYHPSNLLQGACAGNYPPPKA